MAPVTLPCFACRARHPAAVVATLGDGRQLGLCGRCAASRAHRATFIAAFQAHRHATALAASYARHLGAAAGQAIAGGRAPAPASAVPA